MKVFRLISSDKKTGSKNDVFISLFIWYMAIAFLLFLAVYKEAVIPKYFSLMLIQSLIIFSMPKV